MDPDLGNEFSSWVSAVIRRVGSRDIMKGLLDGGDSGD